MGKHSVLLRPLPQGVRLISMVTLQKITRENLEEILALRVTKGQERFVSTVAEALAQAYVYVDTAFPFAVYAGDTIVGFLMLGYYAERKQYTLWKFLVDEHYQGKGYGKEALLQGLDYLRKHFGAQEVYTGVFHTNEVAKALYRSVGFCETGIVEGTMEEMRLCF